MKRKHVVVEMTIILAAATLLGFAANFINPNGVKIVPARPVKNSAADSTFESGGTETGLAEPVIIGKQQLLKLMETAEVLLIDARTPSEFESGHIENAINIPFELLSDYMDRVDHLPKDKWIITYCEGPPCDKAEMLAYELFQMGFPRVAYYEAGLEDWNTNEEVK